VGECFTRTHDNEEEDRLVVIDVLPPATDAECGGDDVAERMGLRDGIYFGRPESDTLRVEDAVTGVSSS